jgi:hypothetical protein
MSNPLFTWPAGKSSAIMVAENAISDDVCDLFVNNLALHSSKLFSPGPVLGGVIPSVKNSMDFSWSEETLLAENIQSDVLISCESEIARNVWAVIQSYRESFRWLWEWPGLCDTGFRIQHYARGNGFYREHVDGSPGETSTQERVLGAIVYLNSVEVGGETFFREHDIYVSAKRGSVALFPATWTHPHQGMIPISNDKWIISTFINASAHTLDSSNQNIDMVTGNEDLL